MQNEKEERTVKIHDTMKRLICVMHKHRKVMEQNLDITGVYQSQHRLLMELAKQEEESQKKLAEKMQVSQASIAVSLKKLEKGGYISKDMDSEDNRLNRITITEKGLQVVLKSRKIFSEIDKETFYGFSDDEISMMNGFSKRILENLNRLDRKGENS